MACTENLASDLFSLFLRMHRMMNKRLAEQGASLARTKLLLFLDRRGPSRAADIADFFDQAPRTVTEAIDGLERDGLVVRRPHPHDRRVKQISITEAGGRVLGETEPLRQELIGSVFGALTDDEQTQLSVLFAKLSAELDAQETPSPDA
ncbi:MarR family winged helix-turn-helix transcriptional regulator [Sphingomonas sp. WKB10]|nr:MarR family winged helix-turn-helix transcriptional regulator [Sphingomonas sp. WKB10]